MESMVSKYIRNNEVLCFENMDIITPASLRKILQDHNKKGAGKKENLGNH